MEKQIKERSLEDKVHDQQEGLENLADHICSRGDIVLTETTRELLKDAFPEGYYLCLVLLSNWESHLNWFGRETVGEWSAYLSRSPQSFGRVGETGGKKN